MNTRAIAIILLVLTCILCAVSFVLLPDTVVTQKSFSGSASSTMPKLLAIGIPALFGAGGSAYSLFSKDTSNKPLIISAVGIGVFIIMLAANLQQY